VTDDQSDAHAVSATPASDDSSAPTLRVVRGDPTVEELAALSAVIAARSSAPVTEPEPLRRPLTAWVASGLAKGTRTKA